MNFLELVKARYSARKYANRPIEAEKLDYIMECVRFAPSAVNFQPWRFRIVTDEAVLKTLYSCYKREWLATAPCIIVACVNHCYCSRTSLSGCCRTRTGYLLGL